MRRARLLQTFAFAGLFILSAGCNALNSNQLSQWNNATPNPVASTPPAPGSTFTVEFHAEGRKPEARQVTLEGEAYVQQALEKSGATKRYSRMNIDIVRMTPQGKRHKMAVAFDSGARRIEPQNNYFLHPGDVIVVTEDPSTIIDDMYQSVTGSPGGKTARKMIGG